MVLYNVRLSRRWGWSSPFQYRRYECRKDTHYLMLVDGIYSSNFGPVLNKNKCKHSIVHKVTDNSKYFTFRNGESVKNTLPRRVVGNCWFKALIFLKDRVHSWIMSYYLTCSRDYTPQLRNYVLYEQRLGLQIGFMNLTRSNTHSIPHSLLFSS